MECPEQPIQGGEACIPNIGERGRQRRLRGGLIWLVAGMAGTVACIQFAAPPLAFAGLFIVYYLAAIGYFQAREKT